MTVAPERDVVGARLKLAAMLIDDQSDFLTLGAASDFN
jgi:hypothetical protein